MNDGPPSFPLTTSERHSLLVTRRETLRELRLGSPDISIRLPGRSEGYGNEFAGGHFIQCFSQDPEDPLPVGTPHLALITLPSRFPSRQAIVETFDMGFNVTGTASDPSQDLLVLLVMLPGSQVTIHLRKLSRPSETHPDASAASLAGMTWNNGPACEHQIADDVVAIFSREESRVIIFNWRTGEELVVRAVTICSIHA